MKKTRKARWAKTLRLGSELWNNAAKFVPADLTRDSIGIWHDNCQAPFRNAVIEQFLNSGFNVASYGNVIKPVLLTIFTTPLVFAEQYQL